MLHLCATSLFNQNSSAIRCAFEDFPSTESRPGVPPPKNGHAVAFFMLAPSLFLSKADHFEICFDTPDRYLHMPFCDGIVGLARDNTAHLFNEKTLGCACVLILQSQPASFRKQFTIFVIRTSGAKFSNIILRAGTSANFLCGQRKCNRATS